MDRNNMSRLRGIIDVILIHAENDLGIILEEHYPDRDSRRINACESQKFGVSYAIYKEVLDWSPLTLCTSLNEKGMSLFRKVAHDLGATDHNAIECIDAWLCETKPRRQTKRAASSGPPLRNAI